MNYKITIDDCVIGADSPTYIIAELSANHNGSYENAVALVHAAKDAGADAIKLQTYTADTLTIQSDQKYFRIGGGTLWDGNTLYELYRQACTPWEWQPKLKQVADDLGITLFSSPFDVTAVDFLETMNVPAYKIASPELVDLPLIAHIARTGKPLIISTGMASLSEIHEAVRTARDAGATQIALLHCISAYPALPEEMNLKTIPHLAQAFDVPVGLSDHTIGIAAPVVAVAQGACIIEKHLTLSRKEPGPDSAFSLEPHEFKEMVDAIRIAEKSLGKVNYELTEHEIATRAFRRSLFIVKDVKSGEMFTENNVRSIRPANGLLPKHLDNIIGRCATQDVTRGTPLSWELVGGHSRLEPSL